MLTPNTAATRSGSDKDFQLLPTDCAILQHIALYGFTFREPLERLFFPDGKDPGNALAALTRHGYLRDVQAGNKKNVDSAQDVVPQTNEPGEPLTFPGGRKYYVLGPRAVKCLGLPKERSDPPKAQALHQNLAVLWYCTMGHNRCYRLDAHELKTLLPNGTPYHNTVHCLANEEDGVVLFRVLVTSATLKSIHKQIRELVEKALQTEALRSWVETGDYGFAILVETEEKRRKVEEIVKKGFAKYPPLLEQARVRVELGPNPQTLGLALREQKKREGAS